MGGWSAAAWITLVAIVGTGCTSQRCEPLTPASATTRPHAKASVSRSQSVPDATEQAPAPVDWPSGTSKPPPQPLLLDVPLETDADGFLVLFDGKNSAGWIQVGAGAFSVENGVARARGGPGVWTFVARAFKDFVLRLEFRQDNLAADSGVFVRIPRAEGDANALTRDAYEIQIGGGTPSATSTGGVNGVQAAAGVELERPGHWNQLLVTARGQSYTVEVNGHPARTFSGERSLSGMIGLANSGGSGLVDFRNVRIKEL